MGLTESNLLLLCVSLGLMIGQLMVKQKQLVHILFAIFCGSIAMTAAQRLSVDAIGHYHYLIGMGACVTCNGSWLITRALFRTDNPINKIHVLIAALIAVLLISRQGLSFTMANYAITSDSLVFAKGFIQEVLTLLSSTIIVLSFWEGCRGWSTASPRDKMQRGFYLSAFALAVSSVSLIAPQLPAELFDGNLRVWLSCYAALFMMLVAQILIFLRTRGTDSNTVKAEDSPVVEQAINQEDIKLASDLKAWLIDQKHYLQANLKVADVARELGVSEYRVSRVLTSQLDAKNFNQYVNQFRIAHAKSLLKDSDKSHWSVLVVGLESGFASVGPFTRSFKESVGCTPGQFRKSLH